MGAPDGAESLRCSNVPSVSVVMPARNAATTLEVQLDALSRQTYDGCWELLVVDNGSTDATAMVAAAFRSRIPHMTVVTADHRFGVNVARNAGIEVARGELILLCDADDRVQDGWVQSMVDALQHHEAVAGKLELEELNDPRILPKRVPHRRRGSLDFLPYAVGANCGFRRIAWEAIGGFDESLKGGGDEVDFFWQMQLAGYRLAVAPAAIVSYRLPETIRADMRRGLTKGRASATLYARFAEHGARFHPWVAVRSWIGLVLRAYRLFGRAAVRRQWLVRAAQQTGKAVGGVAQRKLYF